MANRTTDLESARENDENGLFTCVFRSPDGKHDFRGKGYSTGTAEHGVLWARAGARRSGRCWTRGSVGVAGSRGAVHATLQVGAVHGKGVHRGLDTWRPLSGWCRQRGPRNIWQVPRDACPTGRRGCGVGALTRGPRAWARHASAPEQAAWRVVVGPYCCSLFGPRGARRAFRAMNSGPGRALCAPEIFRAPESWARKLNTWNFLGLSGVGL